jgi:ATP-dependent Clp protease ATP-binding subunit ClpA
VLVRELSADETLDILKARVDRLERHHNVVITDVAVRAAVELTDRYELDRMRPDRAIDALDEACAHAHAVASYSDRAQELIRRRRALVSGRPERKAGARQSPRPEPVDEPLDHPELEEDDPLERMARDGFAALERFGAEIEAIFVPPANVPEAAAAPANGAAATSTPRTEPMARPTPEAPMTLAALDAELHRVLVEEGIVVRGHDIARVVKLATSKDVTWTE